MDTFWDILVASSDVEMRRSIVATLRRLGEDPICASTVAQCREVLAKQRVRLVFCDRQFADGNYRDLLASVASGSSKAKPRIVLTTSFVSPGEYHEAKRSGVFDVIASPCHSIAVEWMVIQAKRDDMKRLAPAIPSARVPGLPKASVAAAKM
jgi:DNA-binding NtrC family response regulator